MITNPNDEYFNWPGCKQAYSWLYSLIANENRLVYEIKTLTLILIVDINWEQDKVSCSEELSCRFQEQYKTKRNTRWSEEQYKLGWQPLRIDFKSPRSRTRIVVFLLFIFLYRFLYKCQIWLSKSHILKEKAWWKKLGTVSQK